MKNLTSVFSLIKVGYNAKKILITIPSNKFILNVLTLLYKEGYIRGHQEHWDALNKKLVIKVLLKYSLRGEPVIENIFRVSAPGRRIYVSNKALWQPKTGKGLFVLSTPKGFLVDRDARLLNVGGELLFGLY